MNTLSIIVLSLLSAGLLFSIVEIGLNGYIIYSATQTYYEDYYCGFDVCSGYVKGTVPNVISFMTFTAVWTTLISAASIGLPMWLHNNNGHGHNYWLAPGLISVYFLTWVFWLAGFADLAYILNGVAPGGVFGAALAFSVVNWVIFMALFILGFLAIFDILKGEWPGYLVLQRRTGVTYNEQPTTLANIEAPAEPKPEEPNGGVDHELTA